MDFFAVSKAGNLFKSDASKFAKELNWKIKKYMEELTMKRRLWSLAIAVLLIASVLCGCGASAGSTAAGMAASSGAQGESDVITEESYGTDSGTAPSTQTKNSDAKLIYTASMNMETTSFDNAVQSLTQLVDSCGGYFESSSINNYGSGYRTGSYVVRVPAEQFDTFCRQVSELCHVTWQTTSTEDVSQYYYDTAGRLKTQQTKLERLQALLGKAEKMEDIITIEDAISTTEEQIDSLSGELQHYDALVDYSTVNLALDEVYKLSNVEEPAAGFGSRVGAALTSGWKNFVSTLESALVTLAYGWVWGLVFIAVAAVAIHTVRKKTRANRQGGESSLQTAEKKENQSE